MEGSCSRESCPVFLPHGLPNKILVYVSMLINNDVKSFVNHNIIVVAHISRVWKSRNASYSQLCTIWGKKMLLAWYYILVKIEKLAME